MLERNLNDKRGHNFWVDLCTYVCFCTCICYVTVFLKLKPACKCVSSWQSGSRPMIDRLCLSLTASLLISQSEIVFRFSFKSQLHPFLFSIHFGFNLYSNMTSTTISVSVKFQHRKCSSSHNTLHQPLEEYNKILVIISCGSSLCTQLSCLNLHLF